MYYLTTKGVLPRKEAHIVKKVKIRLSKTAKEGIGASMFSIKKATLFDERRCVVLLLKTISIFRGVLC